MVAAVAFDVAADGVADERVVARTNGGDTWCGWRVAAVAVAVRRVVSDKKLSPGRNLLPLFDRRYFPVDRCPFLLPLPLPVLLVEKPVLALRYRTTREVVVVVVAAAALDRVSLEGNLAVAAAAVPHGTASVVVVVVAWE